MMMKKTEVAERIDYKTRVSEQYRTVCAANVNFFREVVNFGSLLIEVESYIGESRGRGNEGEGLKGWLAENCPDVNYNTAKGYKLMSAKIVKMIGGGVQAVACLQGRDKVVEPASQTVVDIDPAFIEKRDALFERVESRRQLEQMWFEFCGEKRRPGRPAGSVAVNAKKPDVTDAVTAARADWSKVIVPAGRLAHVLRSAAKLLAPKDVDDALVVLTNLVDILKDRQSEFSGSRRRKQV